MIIVVTGGIGSGKSEVCRILGKYGLRVQYNADLRVKELYDDCPELLTSIEKQLGVSLRDDNGTFLRCKLAEIIFADSRAMDIVESLVFPALMADFESFVRADQNHSHVVFESATVLEKPYFDGFGDMVILVDAPLSMRIHRACMRDNVSRESVLMRVSNQPLMNAVSEGYEDSRVDYVIENDGSYESLETKILKILTDNKLYNENRFD